MMRWKITKGEKRIRRGWIILAFISLLPLIASIHILGIFAGGITTSQAASGVKMTDNVALEGKGKIIILSLD